MNQRRTCPTCKGLKGLWKVPNLHDQFPGWAIGEKEVSACLCPTCLGSGAVEADARTGQVIRPWRKEHHRI